MFIQNPDAPARGQVILAALLHPIYIFIYRISPQTAAAIDLIILFLQKYFVILWRNNRKDAEAQKNNPGLASILNQSITNLN